MVGAAAGVAGVTVVFAVAFCARTKLPVRASAQRTVNKRRQTRRGVFMIGGIRIVR